MFISFIFIGEALRKVAAHTCLYVRKYAGRRAGSSFSGFSWVQNAKGELDVVKYEPEPLNPLTFAPDLSGEYKVMPKQVDVRMIDEDAIVLFLRNHYQQYVNISGQHNKMYICLVVAGHDEEAVAVAGQLVHYADSIRNANIMIDIMMLAPELSRIAEGSPTVGQSVDVSAENETTLEMLRQQCASKQQIPTLHEVLLIQNTNAQRMSMKMDEDALAQLLAWRAVALVDAPQSGGVFRNVEDDVVASFGISCLSFDRYYYLHYLLHHAYLSVMEREGVQDAKVDVNKVAQVAEKCLEGREQVLTGFWDKHVAPHLNAGQSNEQLVPVIKSKIDEFIGEMEKTITSYLPYETLSLPEKRAVMAQILLSDDDILSGALFNTRQLTFLDVLRQPMAFFVDYNNQATTFMKDEEGVVMRDSDTGEPIVEHAVLNRPRSSDGYVHLPIDDIKAMRIQIREASEYIRRMDDEMKSVRKQQNAAIVAQQVVVGEGFQFDDTRFKAVAKVFAEQPLTENYVAESITGEKSVDLSHDFPMVKDQAAIGACAAFAVTSVVEYILKKNKSLASDFSERFVYYNVRDLNGRLEEQGASVSEVINSMAQLGVCSETLCPYSAEHMNDRPSDDAYTEALKHRIIEAKNIPLVLDIQHNIDQLKTAVAEGYPVIASFKVFKDIESGSPFIAMPTEGEEGENHAMVICGFDDETGFFKVRNSWGVAFGDNGYCYIPYAYVGQKKYLNAAYIITQIASSDHVKGVVSKHRISFDSADTAIKIAILSSLRDLKKVQQEQWMEIYRKMYADLIHLNGILKDQSKRNAIVNDTKERLREKKMEQAERLHLMESTMGEKVEAFRRETLKTLFSMVIPTTSFVFIAFLLSWIRQSWGWVNSIFLALAGLGIFILIGYILYREKALTSLKNNLKMDIERQAQLVAKTDEELRLLDMKAFVAGQFIDSLSGLHDHLGQLNVSMKSYVNNLNVWYEEEKRRIDMMEVRSQPPFISLLDNQTLQNYFVQKEQHLTEGIRLWQLLCAGEYDIDEQSVIKFKGNLKKTILEKLNKELGDFSVYGYWQSPQDYPFLSVNTSAFQQRVTKVVSDYSVVLLPQKNNSGDAGIQIFLCHPADKTAQLKQSFSRYSSYSPQCVNTPLKETLIVMQSQNVTIDNISL